MKNCDNLLQVKPSMRTYIRCARTHTPKDVWQKGRWLSKHTDYVATIYLATDA